MGYWESRQWAPDSYRDGSQRMLNPPFSGVVEKSRGKFSIINVQFSMLNEYYKLKIEQ